MSANLPEVEPPEVDVEALVELNRTRHEEWLRWLRIGVPGCYGSPGLGLDTGATPFDNPNHH